MPTDGHIGASVRVTNTGDRPGADVVQLYAHDVVGSVTRPVAQLVGYRRVHLEAGESALVTFAVPTARLAFSDRDLERVVEPGEVEVWVGPSCAERETEARTTLDRSGAPGGRGQPAVDDGVGHRLSRREVVVRGASRDDGLAVPVDLHKYLGSADRGTSLVNLENDVDNDVRPTDSTSRTALPRSTVPPRQRRPERTTT